MNSGITQKLDGSSIGLKTITTKFFLTVGFPDRLFLTRRLFTTLSKAAHSPLIVFELWIFVFHLFAVLNLTQGNAIAQLVSVLKIHHIVDLGLKFVTKQKSLFLSIASMEISF